MVLDAADAVAVAATTSSSFGRVWTKDGHASAQLMQMHIVSDEITIQLRLPYSDLCLTK